MSMLNGIKEMIKKQQTYQEATDLLLEDATGRGIDDIILGQHNSRPFMEADEGDDLGAGMEPEFEGDDPETGEDGGDEPKNPEENDGPAEPEENVGVSDIGSEEIDDPEPSGPEGPAEPQPDPDDIGNQSIDDPVPSGGDQPMAVPGGDLPEPVGAQTGEPAQDDNIVDVNIDLQSNTMRDVLPVPPAGAAQAVASDTMDQHVDSGFGAGSGDEGSEPAATDLEPATPGPGAVPPSPTDIPVEPAAEDGPTDIGDENINNDGQPVAPVTEAITLGGDGGAGDAGAEAPVTANDAAAGDAGAVEEVPADAGVEDVPAEGEGENPVTAAVRDKVAEEEGIDAEGTSGGNEELMKKLSSLTKSIEDAKQLVMKKITTT